MMTGLMMDFSGDGGETVWGGSIKCETSLTTVMVR